MLDKHRLSGSNYDMSKPRFAMMYGMHPSRLMARIIKLTSPKVSIVMETPFVPITTEVVIIRIDTTFGMHGIIARTPTGLSPYYKICFEKCDLLAKTRYYTRQEFLTRAEYVELQEKTHGKAASSSE